ncbi:MAG: hypothetical protein C0468_03990 [Planctomyces sp.]|nr:hypothetical protein [Planctomyces sp.]
MRVAEIQRVESQTEDLGPVGVRSRRIGHGLGEPSDFQELYRIPEGTGTAYDGQFVRIRGGLWAVFPRSAYRTERGRLLAEVPAGTVYLVGGPTRAGGLGPYVHQPVVSAPGVPGGGAATPQRPAAHGPVAGPAQPIGAPLGALAQAPQRLDADPRPPAGVWPNPWEHGGARADRVEALLMRAAAGEGPAGSDAPGPGDRSGAQAPARR